jgi:hypothetical protein
MQRKNVLEKVKDKIRHIDEKIVIQHANIQTDGPQKELFPFAAFNRGGGMVGVRTSLTDAD